MGDDIEGNYPIGATARADDIGLNGPVLHMESRIFILEAENIALKQQEDKIG